MKLFFTLSLIFGFSIGYAHAQQKIVSHDAVTIICDAAKGENPYPSKVVFPAASMPVRKVVMNVQLASPDSLRTAHWDYLDRIMLHRKATSDLPAVNIELGRMLTPYGSVFDKEWKWSWQTDVSDFAHLLRDSVEIVYIHSGYEKPVVGWKLSITFHVFQGPPVAPFIKMLPLWNDKFAYGDPSKPFSKLVKPISFSSDGGESFARIRIQHTGHGMDKPRGCSEFCSRWRKISIDGQLADLRDMWKDCGGNPLYPQGGTWVYDRAYWCPGELQRPDIIDVALKAGRHQVALEMAPYTSSGEPQAMENISSYLFLYGKPLHRNDVAVEAIAVPSDKNEFARENPAGFGPRLVIRNLGSQHLKTLLITYGTRGFKKHSYKWRGDLLFNQTTSIRLPGNIEMQEGENTFFVRLEKPNGNGDEWMGDNEMSSSFIAPPLLPRKFVVEFLTNKRPADNSLFVLNAKDEVTYLRRPEDLQAETVYRDTLSLGAGIHEVCLTDTAGDGLDFWAEPQRGAGYVRFFDLNNRLIGSLKSDCGNGDRLAFFASNDFKDSISAQRYAFSAYPRLTADTTRLSIYANAPADFRVVLRDDERIYEEHLYRAVSRGSYVYHLSNLPEGRIMMEVWQGERRVYSIRLHKAKNGL